MNYHINNIFQKTNWNFFSLLAVILCISLCSCNNPHKKYNEYKPGDTVFLKRRLIKIATPRATEELYELVKPTNGTGEPYLIRSAWAFSYDSLKKYNTAKIGTFIKHDVLALQIDPKHNPLDFYGITTNKLVLVKSDYSEPVPTGYEKTESPFYIFSGLTTKQDTISKKN